MPTLRDYKKQIQGTLDDMPASFSGKIGEFELPASPSARPMSEKVTTIRPPAGKVEVWMGGRPQMMTVEERDELIRTNNELAGLQNLGKYEKVSGGEIQIERIPEKPPAYAGRTLEDYADKSKVMAHMAQNQKDWPPDWGANPYEWRTSDMVNSPEGVEAGLTWEKARKVQDEAKRIYDFKSKQFDDEKADLEKRETGRKAEEIRKAEKLTKDKDRQIDLGTKRTKIAASYTEALLKYEEANAELEAYAKDKGSAGHKAASSRVADAKANMNMFIKTGKLIAAEMDRIEKETGVKAQDVMAELTTTPTKPSGGWIEAEGKEREYIDGKGNVVPAPVVAKPAEASTAQSPESIADAIAEIRKRYKAGAYGPPGPKSEAEKKAGRLIHQIRVGVQGSF